MGLEYLSSVFSDISQNKPTSTSVKSRRAGGIFDQFESQDLIKIGRIEKLQDPSPLHNMTHDVSVTNNPAVKSTENIKVRENQLSFDFGENMKLGEGKLIFDTLYAKNHKANPDRIEGKNTVIKIGNQTINTLEAGIGNLGNLNIKGHSDFFRTGLGFLGKEPYIVHNIPDSGFGIGLQGVGQNRDFIPFRAALDDVSRLAQFYTSPAGVAFMAKENITNVTIGDGISFTEPLGFVMAPPVPVPNTGFLNFYQQSIQGAGLGSIRRPFKIPYSGKADIGLPFGNLGDNLKSLPVPPLPDGFLESKLIPGFIKKKLVDKAEGLLEKIADISVPNVGRPTPFIDLSGGPKKTEYVDKINQTGQSAGFVIGKKDGEIAPKGLLGNGTGDFYVRFKDLRHDLGGNEDNGVFLYFRGFVTGITENVSPSFASTNYIGRSESVYLYERAERDLSFNLRVYPNNKKEFDTMYKKINYLTGMAYPMYLPEKDNSSVVRMKAPFTELYMAHIGSRAKGQFGFIKSISYTVNESGDWDSQTALPRLFDIAISYQILNKKPPSFRTPFYRGQNSAGYTV